MSSDFMNVIVNGQLVPMTKLREISKEHNITFYPGNYWYDKVSGAWGYNKGPAVALIRAGLELGGELRHDASNGRCGVFFNGRQLHDEDVMLLRQLLGLVIPGRYWVDQYGNFGPEHGMMLGNIWLIASSRKLTSTQKRTMSTHDMVGMEVRGAEIYGT